MADALGIVSVISSSTGRLRPSSPQRDTGWAMSQENVEVVRRMYSLLADRGAWRRREYDHAVP